MDKTTHTVQKDTPALVVLDPVAVCTSDRTALDLKRVDWIVLPRLDHRLHGSRLEPAQEVVPNKDVEEELPAAVLVYRARDWLECTDVECSESAVHPIETSRFPDSRFQRTDRMASK